MKRTRCRGLAFVASVIAGLCVGGSPASAEVGAPVATVQAVAADAQFLEYAPPPAAPGVVCLIDSGVDANPDTTPILAGSYALQPGTDTADELSKLNPRLEPGNHADGHGTYMAMIMAAPVNGWGMAGIAPTSVRVFNMKAMAVGQTTFSLAVYATAIEHCVDGPVGVSRLSVVNLSLGSDEPPAKSGSDTMTLAVSDARNRGLDVVGAAGNSGSDVAFPATVSGVLAVGASDANPAATGVFCASSNRGLALGLLAPGCGSQTEPGGGGGGIDVAFSDDGTPAWASGSSDASAIVSAVLASMRAYDPKLTSPQAEGCLTSTAVQGGNLDAAAAFRACGLGMVVDDGLNAYRVATAPHEVALSTSAAAPTVALAPKPTPAQAVVRPPALAESPNVASARVRGGRLVVKVATVPRGAQLRAYILRKVGLRQYRTVANRTFSGRLVVVKRGLWDRISIVFVRGDQRSRAVDVDRDGRRIAAPSITRTGSRQQGAQR